MATKPTKFPEWARDDLTDGTTGQPNVYEPTEDKKNQGFNRQEKPKRQHFNWLLRLTYQWIQWLDQQTQVSSGTFTVQLWDGVSAIASGTAKWTINFDVVTLYLPKLSGTNAGINLYLRGIPAGLLITGADVIHQPEIPVSIYNSSDAAVIGKVRVRNVDDWIIFPDASEATDQWIAGACTVYSTCITYKKV